MGKHRGPRKPEDERHYLVGYCRPPQHTQFKTGHKNSSGKKRSPKHRSLLSELIDELGRPIKVREGGRARSVTKRRAIAINLTNKAVLGDPKACATIFNQLCRGEDPGREDSQMPDESLTNSDQALLEEYLRRIQEDAGTLQEDGDARDSDEGPRPSAKPDQARGKDGHRDDEP